MSPEENLAAFGVRRLPPTPLGEESVDRANVVDVNDAPCRDRLGLVAAASPQTESDFDTDRGAVVRLAAGDVAPFVEVAKQDPGFPFEPDAISALNRLARDHAADFERLRSRLKADTHVRLAALETAMKAAAADTASDGANRSGQPIEYDKIDSWDEPIEGAELLTELARAIDDYVIMDAHQRDAVALWAVFTHEHDLFMFAPLLIILSPTKRCGKTGCRRY